MQRWILVALATMPVIATLQRPVPTPDLIWWTADAMEKVRPNDKQPQSDEGARTVNIAAGRNEFEPFQIVLKAGNADIQDTDVEITDLKSATNSIVSNEHVMVYLERFLDLTTPSSIDGAAGEWPDPLIPRVDEYSHERRNAFPFKLTKGKNQPLWFDVYVPADAAPGTYRGEVRVLVAGKAKISIPVELEVWNLTLPSTSSLQTTFGFSGMRALRQHFGKYTTDQALFDLTAIYEKAGLLHRITVDGSSGVQPIITAKDGKVRIDWADYDRHIEPLMSGQVLSKTDPLYGAKATTVTLHTPASLHTPDEQIDYWRQAAEHFRQKGWFDRLFNYLWDEPAKAQFADMTRLGEIVRQADPTVRNLVTAPLHPEWAGFVDIWTPVINCFEHKPGQSGYCNPMIDRASYNPELSRGKHLWWYQACSSHGCNVVGGDYFRDWPSYMIDHDSVRNRVMEWMTWKYGIEGELYFSMDEAYGGKRNPWQDVRLFGGNGDGTLFYPGTPDVIGGKTHIPIESIRLKLIREGLEDYEYLVMLSQVAGRNPTQELVDKLVTNTYTFKHDSKILYQVRAEIAGKLAANPR
jgi:Glycoside hydrolase 123, catalytic domain/Glycoside hydrolase 123 N-terminal domain